jgi:hypothetical protein
MIAGGAAELRSVCFFWGGGEVARAQRSCPLQGNTVLPDERTDR